MILPQRNQNPTHQLAGAQFILKQYAFQIALLNSLLVHLIVVTYLMSVPIQSKSQLQKPVQLTVQLIKIATPIPVAAMMPVSTAIQMPAEVGKSQMKKVHIPSAKIIQYPQPSSHDLSNDNPVQKPIIEPTQTSIVSLPASSAPEIETPDLASKHFIATSPASATTIAPVNASAPVISSATTLNVAPVKTGVSISASYASSNHKPEYPAMSRRFNEQGTVVLKVLVTEEGTANMVELKTSSGYPLLDESARSAVMQWRFNPATIDGKPTSEFYSLMIPFKLNE